MPHRDRDRSQEVLLEHLDFVRALARRLVLDGSTAEDVVQETALAALAKGVPLGREPRSWLSRVVRNAGRMRGRSEAARREREVGSARGEALPGTDELVSRARLQRRVVDAVLALDEPYRRTVLLRFFDGLPPRAVARREGVPVETVRTRTRRALERLRERLDQEYGDRSAWAVAFAPLLQGGGAAGAVTVGAWIVGAKGGAAAAVAVAVVTVGAAWWGSAGDDAQRAIDWVVTAPERLLATESDGAAEREDPLAAPVEEPARRAAGPSSEARGEPGVRLSVVDGRSGAPVAHAEVALEGWRGIFDADLDGAIERARARGEVLIADAAGSVTALPAARDRVAVGLAGELLGACRVLVNAEDVELALFPDVELTARVVDGDGASVADAPVALRIDSPGFTGAGRGQLLWRGRSDGGGLVVVPHALPLLHAAVAHGDAALVALDVPLARPVELVVRPSDFPSDPIELALPPTGSVLVEVTDARGEPAADVDVRVDAYAVDATSHVGRRNATWDSGWLATDDEGSLRIPRVGTGLRLLVDARLGEAGGRATAWAAGPSRLGEEVVVRVRGAEKGLLLSGRLRRAGGRAAGLHGFVYANVLLADAESRWDNWRNARLAADETGRFSLGFDAADEPIAELELHFVVEDRAGPRWEARVPLPGPFGTGEIDLGDVDLHEVPVVASGVVVDDVGEPVPGAWVRGLVRLASGATAWGNGMRAGEDGAFDLRWEPPLGSVPMVCARGMAYRGIASHLDPEPRPFAIGARDLELVLVRSAAIEGVVRLPDGLAPELLVVEATSLDHDTSWPAAPTTLATRPSATGTYRLQPLWPGAAEVRVVLPWERDEPLLVVDELALEAGKRAADARLADIDLRDVLHRHQVRVRDADGSPVERGFVDVRASGDGAGEATRFALEDGVAVVASRARRIDVDVIAPGHRIVRREGVAGRVDVVLDAGATVLVVLPPDLPPAPDGVEVLVAWRPETERVPPRRVWSPEGEAERPLVGGWAVAREPVAAGRARLRVHGPGPYELALHLRAGWRPDRGGGASTSLAWHRVEVAGDGVVVELDVDREKLEQAWLGLSGP